MTLHWLSPPVGTSLPPSFYQVLCADADGNPLPGEGAYDMTDFIQETNTGTYSPDIDSTPGLTGTPFSDLFTNQYSGEPGRRPPHVLISTIEFDWQFLHEFGSLGVGASVGFQRRKTHSFEFNSATAVGATTGTECVVWNRDPTGAGCVRSGDTTELTFLPMSLLLVYRLDVLDRLYRVPLVPYFKGGLTYYFWWVEHAPGTLSRVSTPAGTDAGIGGTPGLVVQPGLAVSLDFLDPSSARTLSSESGIHHSYVFAELNYAWVSGLGIKDKMVFSDLSWNVGMAAEF